MTNFSFYNISKEMNFSQESLWENFRPPDTNEWAENILKQPDTILMLLLGFSGICANFLSMIATANIPHGLTVHTKLIISLAISDILICGSVIMHVVSKIFFPKLIPKLYSKEERMTSSCMNVFVLSLNTMAHLISLLNLVAMAIDHYIAIMKPLHRQNILSRKKGNIIIIILWLLALIGGFSNFLSGLGSYDSNSKRTYCEYITRNKYHSEYLVFSITFISLFMIVYIYVVICIEIKKLQVRTPGSKKSTMRNKKAMITTLIIIGTFIVCYLPTMLFQIIMIIQVHIDVNKVKTLFSVLLKVNKYLYVLLLLNCLLDPIIYAVRLKEVQHGYRKLTLRCRNALCKKKNDMDFEHSSFLDRQTTTRTRFLVLEMESNGKPFKGGQRNQSIYSDCSYPLNDDV